MSVSRNTSVNDEEAPAAGRPSNWSANKTTYAGRRSRRNSISETDSQLSVENFGGSQDNLNRFVIGKNPDKQPAIVTDSTPSPVRYPRRQSSQEPSDYYDGPPSLPPQQQAQPPPAEKSQTGTPSRQNPNERTNVNQRGGSGDDGSDVVFYGKKKPNFNDDRYGSQRNLEKEQEYYSGTFNQPPPQPQFQVHTNNPYQQQQGRQQHGHDDGNMTVFVMNDRDLTSFGGEFILILILRFGDNRPV